MNEMKIIERNLLEYTKKEIKNFNPYEDLNLFTVLGMENKEVTAHSAFLYSVFKPFRDGNVINCENLKILISTLLNRKNVNVNVNEIVCASIHREYLTEYGRFDFLIEYTTNDIKKNAIVIELKIWAGEQENQIDRYFDYLDQEEYNFKHVFFLTPTGYKSSTDTNDRSIPISLKKDIVKVLNTIINNTNDEYGNYKAILQQYIQLIKKITEGALMEKILNSKEDIIAVGKLHDERTKTLTELLKKFMTLIFENTLSEISNSNIIDKVYDVGKNDFVKYDLDSYYKPHSKSFPRFAFQLKSDKLKTKKFAKVPFDKVDMFFMVEIESVLYCGLTFREKNKEGSWDWFDLTDFVEGCPNTCWVKGDYKNIECDTNKISFNEYEDEQTGKLRLLKDDSLEFDETKINSIVQQIVNEFNDIVSKYFE